MEQDTVAEIKARLDILELVAEYVPLKRAGINHLGLCPFHEEKTPSFTVSGERQSFKCFGCGRSGDIFSFIMEKEGVTFPEALRLLAQKAGVTIKEQTPQAKSQSSHKQQLYELNEALANFWHLLLLKHSKAAVARDYLQRKRGLKLENIKKFKIGYAPQAAATTAHALKKGFTRELLAKAGEPSRFAGRIVFPICDITGRVIGFTGRQLPLPEQALNSPSGPKYWNTPETAVFKKSEALYGLHLAKDSMRKENVAIIAEGQMDVIGFHQVGLTQSIASSGTALTEIQVKIISRFCEEVVFAFDPDSAGIAAAERGFSIALAADLNPTVISLPKGVDPAELARTKPEELSRAFTMRQPIISWLLKIATEEYGLSQPSAKKRITKRVLPWVAKINDPVEQRSWLDVISERIKIPTETLAQSLGQLKNPLPSQTKTNNQPAKPANLKSSDPLTLLIGIIGQHPSLLNNLPLLPQLLAESHLLNPYRYLKRELNQLEREDENTLNGAILTAQREYTDTDLNSLGSECRQLEERARTAFNDRLKQKITAQIKEAELNQDSQQVGLLLKQLQSGIIERPTSQ